MTKVLSLVLKKMMWMIFLMEMVSTNDDLIVHFSINGFVTIQIPIVSFGRIKYCRKRCRNNFLEINE
jgi:hypothetical protein